MGWTTRGLFRAADFHVGVKRKKNSLSGVQWVGVAGVVRLVDVQREGVAAVWIKKKKKKNKAGEDGVARRSESGRRKVTRRFPVRPFFAVDPL
jgi:hypothetical protein